MSVHRFRCQVVLVALTLFAGSVDAQDCAGLPKLERPILDKCSGGIKGMFQQVTSTGCVGNNTRKTFAFERMSRGFNDGLEYDSDKFFFTSLDDSARVVTVDSLRGCQGETVNLELVPGNVSTFEYELIAPSNVTVARKAFSTWSGDKILGESVSLPETGYYTLKTRTTAAAKTTESRQRDGSIRYSTNYPRHFRVGFRSDASVAPLVSGAKLNATVTRVQPFIRHVAVKGGTKVRFRFASMGTGDFLVKVMRGTGEELYRNDTPTGYYESSAFTPKSDEMFRVEVQPWGATQSVGLEFSVVDDKATGEAVTATSKVSSAFKLPANFDARSNAKVSTSETSRLIYKAEKPENLTVTVRPSQLAGLQIRVRIYNEESEELALKPTVVTGPMPLPVALSQAGTWIVELMPVSATDMQEAGDAKYTVEFAPRADVAAPIATSRKPRVPPR